MACPFFCRTVSLTETKLRCERGGDILAASELCADGYARGQCDCFPLSLEEADAIEIAAAKETEQMLVVRFSLERDYLPVMVGESCFYWHERVWAPILNHPRICSHMDAYLAEFEILKNGATVDGTK